jgi:multidrug transporter EmrE-like cation transporter
MSSQLALALAILCEVAATSALKAADGFSRLAPSAVVVVGYGLAFYFLSLALRTIPVGIAYAIWSGVGIVMITAIGWVLFAQKLDAVALFGMALIIAGVLVINVFSGSAGH